MLSVIKEALLNKSGYLTKSEVKLLTRAISFAENAHEGQKRATGEPYIIHPLAVCEILMDYKADITSLVSGLLHDVAEDTQVSIAEINDHFGTQISLIVEGLTKVKKKELTKEENSAINFEKLLLASNEDIRVAIIKIADRLHNMRTLAVKRVEKKVPYANETLIFFAPLAERLGLFKLQEELEELAFGYMNPTLYKESKKLITNYFNLFLDKFNKFSDEIKNINSTFPIKLEWSKLPLYKSYSSIQEDHTLSDLFTIRVITDTPLSCYTILGIIHGIYQPVEHQFEDSLAIEKNPFLKYIRTKVIIGFVEVEVIIQTEADKALYDTGVFKMLRDDLSKAEIKLLSSKLLRDSIYPVKSITNDPIEFYELISFELLQKEIVTFTPKMDTVILPEGSTIIDFAFKLNPAWAKKMSSAKVNGEVEAITYVLQNMDVIEIILEHESIVHSDWLNHAHTSKAQNEIRKIIKE